MAQGSVIVRELIAMLGFELDEDALDEWDERITETTRNVAGAVAGMGTVVVGAIAAATQHLIGMGDDLGDVATRTGVSAQELAEWDHVAQLSGTSADSVRGVLARLPGVMDRVAGGNRAMRETFASLGVEVFDAQGGMRATGDVLQDLVGGLARIRNPTARAAMATRVFGRRGAELAGLFEQGSDGVASLRGEVRELYGADLPGFVEAASRAQDAEDRLSLQTRAFGVMIGAEVLPVVADLLEGAVDGGRAFVAWARDTNVVRPALIALTGVMLGAAAAAAVLALTTVELWALPAIAMVAVALAAASLGFAIDDILTALDGGESVIGGFLEDLFGIEGAAAIFEGVRTLIAGVTEDFEKLLGIWGTDSSSLVTDTLRGWILNLAAIAMGILVIIAGTIRWARGVSELLVGAWTAATTAFDSFLARVTSGLAEARAAIEGVAGYLGIDVSTGARQPGSNASASAATRMQLVGAERAIASSSKSLSVGQIVVQGVSDPTAAAEEIRGGILRMFADESDSAREDLVPEAA